MRQIHLLTLSAVLVIAMFFTQNAAAQLNQPIAPSFTGLKDWIISNRPPETSFDSDLASYPDWHGSCPNAANLISGFVSEFKKGCTDEAVSASISQIKSIGESLEATRAFPKEVRGVMATCFEELDVKNITPEKIAGKLMACSTSVTEIKEKAAGYKEQMEDISKVSSTEELLSVFTSKIEDFAVSTATCTIKAMFTSGDMTQRQKDDVKEEINSFVSMFSGVDLASHLSRMAFTMAKNGFEYFQTEKVRDIEDVLISLDKLSVSDYLKKQSEEFLKAHRFGNWGRTLTLKEKGEEIALLMNSCQVDQALSDLEIYKNMISQEVMERRWALTKDEKNLWCAAQARAYDKMSNADKWSFLAGSAQGLNPNSHDFAMHYNPERDQWRHDLDTYFEFNSKISKVYGEFTSRKIQSARQEEQRERTLIERLTGETMTLVDGQCKDTNTDRYLGDLDMTGERLKRARDSKCGQAGFAADYKLDMLVKMLDIMKEQTESQLKIRQETVNEFNDLLSTCRISEAWKAVENARLKMDAMKPDRMRIDDELDRLKSGDATPGIWAPDATNIKGYDRCYASTFSMLEKQIKDEQDYLENFLKNIDAEIQPARRALENCDGPAVFSDLRETRAKLTNRQCNAAPGISARLREIELLEKALDPASCTGIGGAACKVTPDTAPLASAKYYTISQRRWGSDGAAHCLTDAEAADLNAKEDTTLHVEDGSSCTKCPGGFSRVGDNGSEACVRCPDGMTYQNGCCF